MSTLYETINDALQRSEVHADAAECHGALSAFICTLGENSQEAFFGKVLPELPQKRAQGDALAIEALQLLDTLFVETEKQLNEGAFAYDLLLPDDDASIATRAQALGHWCQGFMLGLQSTGVTVNQNLPGDLAEVMKDISEISQVSLAQFNEDEEEEQSYAELVEYIRVGVMLFREEFQPLLQAGSAKTLH